MPRKSAAAAPSAPRASASGSRANKPRRAAPSEHSDDGEDALDLDLDADMDVGDADEPEGADKEDEQLLVMLRELRKKSTKSSSRASARQKQVSAACAQHRALADALVRDMNAYIDKIAGDALEMADTTGAAARVLSEGARQWGDTHTAISAANAIAMTKGDLPRRRVAEVDAACTQIEELPARQAKSHRRLMRTLKADFARLVEDEQVASDANALIKKMKALLH